MRPPQRQTSIDKKTLDRILDRLETRVFEGGTWEIGVDELCSLAGIEFIDGYRSLYQVKQLVSGYIPKVFEFDNLADMLSLLSDFSDIDIDETFASAGAYLGREETSELSALYYDEAIRMRNAHTPDCETFAQMLERFRTPHRAFSVYKEFFFDVDSIAENTIKQFQRSQNYRFPRLGEYTIRRSIDRLFRRHILSNESLFEPLLAHLSGTEDNSGSTPQRDPAVVRALEDLGLPRLPDSIDELRSHYKSLMKTYHPDINPGGLEISKRINTAYAELVARAM